MNIRKSLLAVALAGSFAVPLSVQAASATLEVDIAPPAPVVEQTTIREGYVYTPGYWRYEEPSHKHVWIKGEYVPERRGEHWVAHEWRENDPGGKIRREPSCRGGVSFVRKRQDVLQLARVSGRPREADRRLQR